LQISKAASSSRRTVVREDWALVALVGGAQWGGDWSPFVVVDPDASVVPVSL
jgi:hypothetical protein